MSLLVCLLTLLLDLLLTLLVALPLLQLLDLLLALAVDLLPLLQRLLLRLWRRRGGGRRGAARTRRCSGRNRAGLSGGGRACLRCRRLDAEWRAPSAEVGPGLSGLHCRLSGRWHGRLSGLRRRGRPRRWNCRLGLSLIHI